MILDNVKVVLFDLDGTLLPMDEEYFTKLYFKALAARCAPLGYETESLIKGVWSGTAAMIKNDGKASNKDVFWRTFADIFGDKAYDDAADFDEFYRNEFACAKEACGFNPLAAEAVNLIKSMGLRTALATNPVFPRTATENRVRWAGLDPKDFELITVYENSSYCKPNPDYYLDICTRLGVSPSDCLMVGNDVKEDMCAEKLGMKVFLLTDCLINTDGLDCSSYPQGGFSELIRLIKEG